VRAETVRALASFSQTETLPLLRELTKDQNWRVRAEAVKSLTSFSPTEALPMLRELALASDHNVAAEAVRGLASLFSREELEEFLNRYEQDLSVGAIVALDELLYMPEWLKAKEKEQERHSAVRSFTEGSEALPLPTMR
jgi:HEAT repeat protein